MALNLHAECDPVRNGLMEEQMYKKLLRDVRQSTTLPARTKMVGIELYSDKTFVS